MGRRAHRYRLGTAGHVHGRRRAGRADHHVPTADRDPARLLASGQLRLRGGDPGPPVRRPGTGQRRVGRDDLAAYGDSERDQAHRYDRTREFIRIVRKLWTQENVTHHCEHFRVTDATVVPRPVVRGGRPHPRLYFGGASEAAEKVAAIEADVQLFWGEPLDGVAERIERLKQLSQTLGREHAPLEFGLRVTTLVRNTTEEAWADAEAKVAQMAKGTGVMPRNAGWHAAVRQQRLLDLAARGEVLDDNLYTTPGQVRRRRRGYHVAGRVGPGRGEVVAPMPKSLRRYQGLGITHFVLSDGHDGARRHRLGL